jgi:hypothetical protein
MSGLIAGVNTYVTLPEADDYLCVTGDGWAGLPDSERARLLLLAARWIDGLPYKGRPADPGQPMCFPRGGQTDVPKAVRRAQCEEALALADKQAVRRADDRASGLTSVSVGRASESYGGGAASRSPIAAGVELYAPAAWRLLRPWLAVGGGIV